MIESKEGTTSWAELKGSEKAKALQRGYDDNGGTYIKWGAQYLVSRRDLWRPVVFYIEMIAAGYISIFDKDMETVSEAFHFVTMITNMMIITGNLLYYRKTIDDLFTAIGAGFFDYGDTIDPKTKAKMESHIREMRVKKRFRFRIFVLVVWILGGCMLVKVLLAYFRFGDTIDGEGGRPSRKHAVATWIFNMDQWPNYIFMATSTYAGQVLTMNSIWGFVLPVICFAEELSGQLDLVGMGLRHATTRAKYLFNCRYGEYRSVRKSKYAECIRDVLKASVQHHNIVLEACSRTRTLLNLPLMTVMFGTAVLLCMSGFVLVEETVPIIAKIISLLFIGGELFYSYLFCLYGEMMTSKSREIGDRLYDDKWEESGDVIRPYFVMINLRARRPIRLSAGGFMEVNLAAFSSVISSSYSYFNLMFTSKS